MKVFRIVMGLLVLGCLLPLILSLGAELVGTALGCEVDLTGAHPCVIGGHDIGHALLVVGMLGYGMFFTFPVLIVLVPLWAIIELIQWLRTRRVAA